MTKATVVAGVDGTSSGLDAVTWAARESETLDASLRLVHAFGWPLLRVPRALYSMGPPGGLRAQALGFLDEAADVARTAVPGLEIEQRLVEGFPAPLLINESASASFVVIGSRGLGPISGLLASSTAIALAAHAHAPVAVVRKPVEEDTRGRPVVVAVDGSETGDRAVKEAVMLATRRHRPLIAINVRPAASQDVRVLERSLEPWRERFPGLPIEERMMTGHAAGVLTEASGEAFAVVVGSHGRGGFAGMLLGSVSQSLLHHARCPVVVVPARVQE